MVAVVVVMVLVVVCAVKPHRKHPNPTLAHKSSAPLTHSPVGSFGSDIIGPLALNLTGSDSPVMAAVLIAISAPSRNKLG